jgi:molybdate transport system regulatory protein
MTQSLPVQAVLQLRKGPASRVGPDRIRLLTAIQAHGSITAAAKEVGLSYKGAWDAVQALNNLFERHWSPPRQGGATAARPRSRPPARRSWPPTPRSRTG